VSTRVSTRARGDLLANKTPTHGCGRTLAASAPVHISYTPTLYCKFCMLQFWLLPESGRRRASICFTTVTNVAARLRGELLHEIPCCHVIARCSSHFARHVSVCNHAGLRPVASPLTRRRKADARGPKRVRIVRERGVVGTKETSSMPSKWRGEEGRSGVGGITVSKGTHSVGQVSPHTSSADVGASLELRAGGRLVR
jgi:hypothetical protein